MLSKAHLNISSRRKKPSPTRIHNIIEKKYTQKGTQSNSAKLVTRVVWNYLKNNGLKISKIKNQGVFRDQLSIEIRHTTINWGKYQNLTFCLLRKKIFWNHMQHVIVYINVKFLHTDKQCGLKSDFLLGLCGGGRTSPCPSL